MSELTDGNVIYTLTSASSGNTASAAKTNTNITDATILDSVTDTSGTEYIVTSIGINAFNVCSELTAVTIGANVTLIGEYAFKDCFKLTAVIIPDAVTSIGDGAFLECYELTAVTIGANVTSIGDSVFSKCSKLTAVTISSWNTTFFNSSNGAVYQISGYTVSLFFCPRDKTTFTIPDSVTNPNEITTIETEYTVTSIVDNAFQSCSELTAVIIGANVTSIGTGAFYSCSKLTAVTIPDAVTSIGNCAFESCSKLTSMYFLGDLPSSLGNGIFTRDNSLTSYYLDGATGWSSTVRGRPAQVITAGTTGVASITAFSDSNKTAAFSIADNSYTNVELVVLNGSSGVTSGKAFALSSGKWTVTSPALVDGDVVKVFLQTSSGATVTQLLSYSYDSTSQYYSVDLGVGIVSIGNNAFSSCFELTAVTIGAKVTSIGISAFYSCFKLTAVTIPNSVTLIDNYAFNECFELTAVIIPDAVTSIGHSAFYRCFKLTAVIIPDAVTSIGDDAFKSCLGLTSMYFLGDLPSSLGSNLFLDDGLLTLYYLDGETDWPSTVDGKPVYPIPTITSATTSSVSISADSDLSTVYVYTSTDSGTTWTTNSVTMTNGSGTLHGLYSGTLVSTIANMYDATTYEDYCKTVTNSTPTPSSNVCFPAKTPILTNCGPINIEDIDPAVHTIRNKKIVAITKTVAHDKNLVRIAKHALGHLYPEKPTLISQNHKVFFQGQMVKAKHLVDEARGVTLVPYNGQVLYNVLLEQYEKMQVNNLIVETLHPEHKVAKLYRFLQNVDAGHHGKLIALFNKKDKEHRIHF